MLTIASLFCIRQMIYHAKIANDFDFFRLRIYHGCC